MLIDKTFKRKILTNKRESVYFISIPMEVKGYIDLDKNNIGELSFNDEKEEISIKFKEISSNKPDIIERKIMNINNQAVISIPIKKAREYGLDSSSIIELDGSIENKELLIKKSGIDISEVSEVLDCEEEGEVKEDE